MKKIVLLTTYYLLLTTYYLHAQNTDKYWACGRFLGLDFRTGACVPDTNNTNKNASADVNSQVNDVNGNILFWTNGYFVMDKNFDTLPNGKNFNHSTNDNQYINSGGGLPLPKGCLMLPNPKDSNNLFWMFYENVAYTDAWGGSHLPSQLKCLLIDKRLNGGLGDVIFKDSVIIQDSLMQGNIFAIRHGNGSDWWVIVRKYSSNKFYKILIDTNGIHAPSIQNIGNAYTAPYQASGCSGDVSRDGNKLAYPLDIYNAPSGVTNPTFQIDVFDFDRCTGILSNPVNTSYNFYPDTCEISSVCFSPSSKILYACRYQRIYQFYLDSINIYQSKRLIQRYDGAVCLDPAIFFQMKRGIDNKVYVSIYGSAYCMHIVNNPDVVGAGCNFVQHQLNFSSTIHFTDGGLPNTPNYSLGKLNCGMGVDEIKTSGFEVYPNPANNLLFIKNTTFHSVSIYNLLGELEQAQAVKINATNEIDISRLSNGLHFLKGIDNEGIQQVVKFVKE